MKFWLFEFVELKQCLTYTLVMRFHQEKYYFINRIDLNTNAHCTFCG